MRATALLLALAACGGSTPAAAEPPNADSSEGATPTQTRSPRYTTRGSVEELRPERRQVVIHHQEVPGYMPEMTMPFSVEDSALFEGLAVGQRVEFTFSVEPRGRHVVRAIRPL